MNSPRKEACKKINTQFRNWYFSQPANQLKELREQIIEKCKINKSKWSNWLYGLSTPNTLEREIISVIAGTEIFN